MKEKMNHNGKTRSKLILCILLIALITAGLEVICSQFNKPVSVGDELQTTAVLPHDSNSFTEGLFFYQNQLYESSGLYEKSYLFTKETPDSTDILKRLDMPSEVFAEGIVVFDNMLYALTWQENKAYQINPDTLEILSELPYSREGWGLTTDGEYLIASDGTDEIFFMDRNLQTLKSIHVTENGISIDNLNELEYIDGFLYANIWQTNDIAVIDTETGTILKRIDCTPFLSDMIDRHWISYSVFHQKHDVLNGIAYNKDTDKLYITGKCWKNMYECTISENFRKELTEGLEKR